MKWRRKMIECALETSDPIVRKAFLVQVKVKGLATKTIDENRTIDVAAGTAREDISRAVFRYLCGLKNQ
jgi:hypothetical protein